MVQQGNNMEATLKTVLTACSLVLVLSLLLSLPIYWLWNGCLVGAISGVNEVTWLQAWGINVLSTLLFKTVAKAG
jgi:hypothetical protein